MLGVELEYTEENSRSLILINEFGPAGRGLRAQSGNNDDDDIHQNYNPRPEPDLRPHVYMPDPAFSRLYGIPKGPGFQLRLEADLGPHVYIPDPAFSRLYSIPKGPGLQLNAP